MTVIIGGQQLVAIKDYKAERLMGKGRCFMLQERAEMERRDGSVWKEGGRKERRIEYEVGVEKNYGLQETEELSEKREKRGKVDRKERIKDDEHRKGSSEDKRNAVSFVCGV